MNTSLSARLTHILAITLGIVIILLPFHAFLTVWLSAILGHYTLLRLWKEFVLVAVGLVALGLLYRDRPMRQALVKQRLFWLVLIYLVFLLFLGVTSFAHHQVSREALAYGLLEDSRYLLFFGLCLGIALRDKTQWLQRHWAQLILWPALIVVAFGLAQAFILPNNFLQHFGYSSSTIAPFSTVNSNLHFIRVQSTLRGANPLGAYLILVIAAIAVQLKRVSSNRSRLALAIFGLATLVVIYFTYSRSAWIGAALTLVCLGLATINSSKLKLWIVAYGGIVLVVVLSGGLILRHNSHFDDLVFHTSPNSVMTTSDQNHETALEQGLHVLADNPLGLGPGTAGPASFYNHDGPVRLAENYFVQIGEETGWLGLALFIVINVVIGLALWRARANPLALALGASLIGISFVGMLSHVWSDDSLSYIWWGLAGLALSPYLKSAQVKDKS